ncbi:MAG: M36 family metallopeptidase [Chloroflexota bacterium]
MPRSRSSRILISFIALAVLTTAPATASAAPFNGGGVTASALVFYPNPVVTSGNLALTDQKDADYAALNNERVRVLLTNLDGSGSLCGAWACVVGSTKSGAFETDGTYFYTRHDERFEQVMAYYWVTQSQLYIQSLGFRPGGPFRAINADSQAMRINQWGVDNSFASDAPKDQMVFGKGGVDDAEDAEVILHEYGHQIHFSQSATFYSTTEAGSIGEGFGDYWAATVSVAIAGPQPDPACIAEWDSISYTAGPVHCLRRLDANLTYPTDLSGRIHHDGMIWSQALWQIRGSLGNVRADTSILMAQFDWTGTTMVDLANRTVAAARSLYGNGAAVKVRQAFEARGIL